MRRRLSLLLALALALAASLLNQAATAAEVVDLKVSIADSPDPVNVGSTLTYTVRVTNDGAAVADKVEMYEALPSPAHATIMSITGDGWTCRFPAGSAVDDRVGALLLPKPGSLILQCSRASLAAGATAPVEIKMAPLRSGAISTSAVVASSGDPDSDPDDNSATTTTTVREADGSGVDPPVSPKVADLSLQLADSPDPVEVGEPLTYTSTVTNDGPDAAANVQLFHVLPPPEQARYGPISTTTGTCTFQGQVVPGEMVGHVLTCFLGELPPRTAAVVTVTVQPNTSGTLVTSASTASLPGVIGGLTPPALDPNDTDNHATSTTTVSGGVTGDPSVADLSVEIMESADPTPVGSPLTYTLRATNKGPGDAAGVEIVDVLPSEAQATFHSSPSCGAARAEAPEVRVCLIGELAAGASASFEITVTPSQAGALTNIARVGAASGQDLNPADNQMVAVTTVGSATADADLSVAVTESSDPVVVRTPLSYTVTVSNNGPDRVPAVWLSDTVSESRDVSLDSYGVEVTPSQGACEQSVVRDAELAPLRQVTCALGAVDSGSSATVTIRLSPAEPGALVNVASVSGAANDPDASDNQAAAVTTVTAGSSDLSVTMVDRPDPVVKAATLLYEMRVKNEGPDLARNVVLVDQLPNGVAYLSSSASFDSGFPQQGPCTPATPDPGTTLTCGLNDLASGKDAVVRIRVRPTQEGTVENKASVASQPALKNACAYDCRIYRLDYPSADPFGSNNQASATTTVNAGVPSPLADLELTKKASVEAVPVGEPFTYSLNVFNHGPDQALADVRDQLPPEIRYRSAWVEGPEGGLCSLPDDSSLIICKVQLEVGSFARIVIEVSATRRANTTNIATVVGGIPDPFPSNNTGEANVATACGQRPTAPPGSVLYEPGWSLIGVPPDTHVGADSPLFGWFDQGGGEEYGVYSPGDILNSGQGYWAFFACPQVVSLASGTSSASFPLGGYHASMVGNPSSTSPAVVSGYDFGARWDRSTSSYEISEPREPMEVKVGEGIWVFSYEDSTIQIEAG